MATDRDIRELLAAGDEALAEAGFRTGDFGRARELLEAAHTEAFSGTDLRIQASALDRLGMLAHYENITKLMSGSEVSGADIDAEEKLFRQALARWEELGEPAASAHSHFGLGLVFQVLHKDWMTAMPYFWQALGLVNDPDAGADLYLRSEVHRHVGYYFLVEDVQPIEAVRHLQISLQLREELGDERRIPSGLVVLGQAELTAGHPERAVELLQRAVAQARAAGLLQARIEDAERALREAEEQTGPEAQAGPDAQAEPEATAEPQANAEPDREPEATAESDPEPELSVEAETGAKPEGETRAESEAETGAAAEGEADDSAASGTA